MKISVRPNSRCRSRSRLSTCAWIETSSAETGSSAIEQLGFQRERARDADALALAAGELVRVAVVVLGAQADALQQLLHRLLALAWPFTRPWITNGSAMIEPTVLRGFSEE